MSSSSSSKTFCPTGCINTGATAALGSPPPSVPAPATGNSYSLPRYLVFTCYHPCPSSLSRLHTSHFHSSLASTPLSVQSSSLARTAPSPPPRDGSKPGLSSPPFTLILHINYNPILRRPVPIGPRLLPHLMASGHATPCLCRPTLAVPPLRLPPSSVLPLSPDYHTRLCCSPAPHSI